MRSCIERVEDDMNSNRKAQIVHVLSHGGVRKTYKDASLRMEAEGMEWVGKEEEDKEKRNERLREERRGEGDTEEKGDNHD